jgi:hypothetical protein
MGTGMGIFLTQRQTLIVPSPQTTDELCRKGATTWLRGIKKKSQALLDF